MAVDLKSLWQRERARRAALWELEEFRPGDDRAKPHLSILDEIDRQDLEHTHGEAQFMTIEELRDSVPETLYESSDGHHFVIVLDKDIPEVWRTRFEAANALAERFPEGSYAQDWRRFLRVWQRDMEHLKAHREGSQNDQF
ncbi:hypothetical protein EAH74_32660 [Pseudomonas mandelii]|uniref:Uncharacterized protein n=2 Tax=Pseudomonas mandelii TaxID=75612 RepID=A0A502HG26_9PSED|nr:hypothetical protein EAH74_32660 [Pseudomonas mandelii]